MNKFLRDLKNILNDKDNEYISEGQFTQALNLFKDKVFKISENKTSEELEKIIENQRYSYNLEDEISFRCYKNKTIVEAIKDIYDNDIDKFEWTILFSKEALWLINNNIKTMETEFRSNKIVLRVLFNSKTDLEYLEYFSYDNLVNNKKSYYFKDIISYKNSLYSAKENNWYQYHGALKRFFHYYISLDNYKRDETKSCYDEIKLRDFIGYIKFQRNIRSNNSVKNQFFYVKDFMMKMTNNKNFNVSSNVVLKSFKSDFNPQTYKVEESDIFKMVKIIQYLECRRNGIRDTVVFLFLLCYGIERRKLCEITWHDIDEDFKNIKIDKRWINMPHIMQEKLRLLRSEVPIEAVYVLGNTRTKYIKPIRVELINGIMEDICNIDTVDPFYKMMSPINIRKWLFKYMLKRKEPLQNIIKMMNISTNNISSYVSDEELWEYTTEEFCSDGNYKYILDDFMNNVEKLK